MPELPEVETIRRHLAGTLPGQIIAAVLLLLPKLVQAAPGLTLEDLVGRSIVAVDRRAKQLIVDCSGDLSLLIHLRMTGQLVLERATGERLGGGHPVPAFDAPLPHKSTHLTLSFASGDRLFLTDMRQFGVVRLAPTAAVPDLLAAEGYGPDALDPAVTVEVLSQRLLAYPKARLKPTLLDQTVLAGLGNIYIDEALFTARLHPTRTPQSLTLDEAHRLLQGIQDALDHGLRQGGFAIINGRARPFEGYPRVHGLAGAPCPRCAHPVEKTVVGGRGTYLCPACQPARGDLHP